MLGLSPPQATAPYAAAWFAWTQLAYSLSILAGGQLFDWIVERGVLSGIGLGTGETTPFRWLFIAGGMLMAAGIALAARVPEPENNGDRR